MKDQLAQTLSTMAATSAAALELWCENELRVARDWSQLPELRRAARSLALIAANAQNPRDDLLAAADTAQLLPALEPLRESEDYDGFGLVGRGGLVLAASDSEQVGRTLTQAGSALLAAALKGPLLTPPYQRGQMLSDVPSVLDAPLMLALTPVPDEHGEAATAFYLMLRIEKDFARILFIARPGEHGDAYAFDRQGLMLSDSRHEQQLKELGLIPPTAARSILRIQLRDPGGDLTRGYRPRPSPDARPLTKLIAAATTTEFVAGVATEPYRDIRGVPVVGAYRWLSKYGIGIATELPADRAFAATRPLRLMVLGLVWLVVAGGVLLVAASVVVQWLRGRVEQVKQLGQYTLGRKLGEGGMGEVYMAHHALLQRPTAVKFIRAQQVNDESLERFEREVQRTSQLTSPHTIEIYDFGCTEHGVFYYVMEYLPGLDLGDLLELDGAVPAARAVHILKQLCTSLAEAHAHGLIHRDIKPPNVFLTERGGQFDFVKVLDFGLVKHVAECEDCTYDRAGTLPYVAPERLRDANCLDPRADLYSVGVIAFNLLTGKQPFEGRTPEVAYQIANVAAPRVSKGTWQAIPSELDDLVADCLARDPEHRPRSAEALVSRLEALKLASAWDQQNARRWWASNAQRLAAAGYDLATAARPPSAAARGPATILSA